MNWSARAPALLSCAARSCAQTSRAPSRRVCSAAKPVSYSPFPRAVSRDDIHVHRAEELIGNCAWKQGAVLASLKERERVYPVGSDDDLRWRISGRNRTCYVCVHSDYRAFDGDGRSVLLPLGAVYIYLTNELSGNVQKILKASARDKEEDVPSPSHAIFYSISTHEEAARLGIGNKLIKGAKADLAARYPSLACFSTLSPMTGFRAWLEDRAKDDSLPLTDAEERILCGNGASVADAVRRLIAGGEEKPSSLPAADSPLGAVLVALGARYIAGGSQVENPIAQFHLRNGALVARIVAGADRSRRGARRSLGLMANYEYAPGVSRRGQRFRRTHTAEVSAEVSALIHAKL